MQLSRDMLDGKGMGADLLGMWGKPGMQGFLGALRGRDSISRWLLACILDAVIPPKVSIAVNCFRISSELPD